MFDTNVKVVPVLDAAADAFNGDPTTSYINMAHFESCRFVIQEGASTAAGRTVTVLEATSSTGGSATAIDFHYQMGTDADEGAVTSATTAGFSITASTASRVISIFVDAQELSTDNKFVAVTVTETTAAPTVAGAITAILSGPRYSGPFMTALS